MVSVESHLQRGDGDSIPVTVLIAARNEAVNIRKCLEALVAFERVVVLDSASTDTTAMVAEQMGREVVQFLYKGGYPKKRQWALENIPIDTEWVLLLDADEVVPPSLCDEVKQSIANRNGPLAYSIVKGFHFMGRKMRFGGFSHAAVLLFRKGRARFEQLFEDHANGLDMEVHERLIVDGKIGRLATPLVHQDFKGLEAYIERHNRYSSWEASVRWNHLQGFSSGDMVSPKLLGNFQERRRFLKWLAARMPGESWLWFIYHFFWKLGFLEGRRGLIASQIRSQYIANVHAKIFELKLNATS